MHFLSVTLGYHPDVLGGAWRVAAEQAIGLAARGHQVEVITAHPGGDLPAVECRGGVRVNRYPQGRGSFFASWRAENRAAAVLIRERLAALPGPALLIQHHAYLEPAVATVAARVLHVYHGPWAEEFRFSVQGRPRGPWRRALDPFIAAAMRRVEYRALRRADRVLVLSRHVATHLALRHRAGFPSPRVVPGGVDFQVFQPFRDREATRAGWGVSPEQFLLVAVRRLDPRMGLDVLLDAFAAVSGEFPNARLRLGGTGVAEEALRRQIARLGLDTVARLLGRLEETALIRLLNAADAAVVPSLDLEGFGLATLEALACGTPVLGSRAGATPELLEDFAPDLLFEPGSVAALAASLRRVLREPGRLPQRQACTAYVRQRFSWDAQVEACECAARELLSRSDS